VSCIRVLAGRMERDSSARGGREPDIDGNSWAQPKPKSVDKLRSIWQSSLVLHVGVRAWSFVRVAALVATTSFAGRAHAEVSAQAPAAHSGSVREVAAGETDGAAPGAAAGTDEATAQHWCAPGLTASSEQATGTLVIFLHSLVSAAPTAAWEQQLRMQRLADSYDFTILIPQGRPGLGPGRDPGVLAWPTAQELQVQYETELLAEWRAGVERARALGGAFARVFLIGFSNGAYYATSLTFRERFPCDGVAVFAGGSGSKYQRLTAARAKRRTPMFVGYGTLDPDNRQQRALVSLLKALGWPHRALAAKVGHTVAAEQLRAALRFLGHPGIKAP
jgi:predicted esterase